MMLTRVAAVTESVPVPEMLPNVAVTVTEPGATLVTTPNVPPALLTVATVESDVLQCTLDERSRWLPSA